MLVRRRWAALCCLIGLACAPACSLTEPPSDVGLRRQPVGTPPPSRLACTADVPCRMPLLSAGYGTSVLVRSDGAAWGWGSGFPMPQDKTTETSPVRTPAGVDVVASASGRDHSLLVLADGRVYG